MQRLLIDVIATVVVLFLGMVVFAWTGWYPIGADVPHYSVTTEALTLLRERAISNASAGIKVPPLDDPSWLIRGGADYDAMCTGCHLKPGQASSDLSLGLYPAPPNLTQSNAEHGHAESKELTAARQFWVIKHGIKASGMPAWGITHDDQRIWEMVAFLQKLPDMTPIQYQILTGRSSNKTPDASHQGH